MRFFKTFHSSLLIVVITFSAISAQQSRLKKQLNAYTAHQDRIDLTTSGQWFLSYQRGKKKGTKFSNFILKRGYLNIKKKFTDRISGRMTSDISVDREGDGEGDLEIRLKYCYLRYSFSSLLFFNSSYMEFGLVHRPWFDFEEKINRYRLQGPLFFERSKVVNSADYGITFVTDLGDKLNPDYQRQTGSSFVSKYGSFAIGWYNGGGYHAIEKNTNKTIETRLTIRPFFGFLPNLQLSYHGAFGKGNTEAAPDWKLNSGFLSFEHKYLILTAMYFNGTGNYRGTLIDKQGNSINQTGFSAFYEIKCPGKKFSLIGCYDHIDVNTTISNAHHYTHRYIVGVAYHFIDHCKLLVDYDKANYRKTDLQDDEIYEITVELGF